MTDELRDVKPFAVALLVAAMGLLLFAPTASAQEAACTAGLENRSAPSNTSSAPGGLLADAIGDQRDEIGSALNDRWFDARLANATSDRTRARIVASEVERIEMNVSTLERCWGINRSEHVANRSLAELDDDERAGLDNYTRSLHRRLNETRVEADRLPAPVRKAYDIDPETLRSLERRLVRVRNVTAREATASTTGSTFPFP